MVRNAESMQNLRGSISQLNVSSTPQQDEPEPAIDPASPRAHDSSSAPFATPSKRPSMQLCGNDGYTKALMNRIATGQATVEDQAAFNEYVNKMQTLSSPPAEPCSAPSSGDKTVTDAPRITTRPPRDHRSHLQLLEEQSSKLRAEKAERRKSKGVQVSFSDIEESMLHLHATRDSAAAYTKPFCEWLTENPTVFHAVSSLCEELEDCGWTKLDERDAWDLEAGGKYCVSRNGSSLIAFVVGEKYEPGNGAAVLAGHVDALTAKLKPVSEVPNQAGYLQLGVAPYAGALNSTWWDRDLGIGGRVLVKEGGKIITKLVKLDYPIARIPTLAPHFGAAANGPFNQETQMVPIIGLDSTDSSATDIQTAEPFSRPPILHGEHEGMNSFVNTQPKALVKAIGDAIGLSTSTYSNIVNWVSSATYYSSLRHDDECDRILRQVLILYAGAGTRIIRCAACDRGWSEQRIHLRRPN